MDGSAGEVRRARALVELHETLGEAQLDLEVLLERAAIQVADLLGNSAAIWALERGAITLRAFAQDDPVKRDLMVSLTDGVQHSLEDPLGIVISGREPLTKTREQVLDWLPHLEAPYRAYYAAHMVEGLLVVPLWCRGEPLGALGVTRDEGGEPFTPDDVAFLQQVARVVALTLANAVLFDEAHEARRRTEAMSREDDLTGLLNRRGFLDDLRAHLEDPHRESSTLVAVLDMDGFRLVNDGFGHAAGDLVLAGIAARLCAALPPGTPVARIGADEFAILVEALDDEMAADIVEQAVLECSGTLTVVGLSVPLRVSVGTVVPASKDADEALLQADLAMTRAKRRGAMVAAYDPRLDDPATRRLRDVLTLRRVISAGELVVHYQPVVPVGRGPMRLEALVRRNVEGRLLPPNGWLQTAASAGLMPELTDSVLGKVVDQLERWWGAGLDIEVAVNVPAPVLAAPEVVNAIVARLDKAGLPRRALSVEVTEGDLVGPQAKAALTRCHDADIGVAVDDFGTGWSALSYLVDLPLRTLKIDRSFVDGCDVDPRRACVVRAVVDIAHELDLSVIAEGVETRAVADAVIDLGADAIQGYLFARPSSAGDLDHLLRSGLVAVRS
ncbi:MAG: Diguanylate kinase [Frankiales bacterium]|nr:Diguanylate kinase [Frankiales bacterium]